MLKKSTQTLVLAFSTLLLLVSLTASAQAQDFTGAWNTIADNGTTLVIALRQTGDTVRGSYAVNGLRASNRLVDDSINGFEIVSASMAEPVPQNLSSIKGTVDGNVLSFTWQQDRGHGAGRFTLSSDGQSFQGTFSRTSNPDDTSGGTWNGTRMHSFAGAWQGKFGEGAMELILQQANDRVTGRLRVNSAELGIIKDGKLVGNTLRFTLFRPNKMAGSPDEQVGTGELVMDSGGKSFSGTILGAAASGNLVGR